MYTNTMLFQSSHHRCCGFINLRFGCGLICLIWAAFSMYLAVLSFQNSSLFYSYMPSAPTTVYGVCNLILSLVSVGGIFLIIWDVSRYIRGLSHAIFVSVFIVLVDSFINIILFITSKNDYYQWCINTASNQFVNSMNNSSIQIDMSQDYYNCHNLWQDELKFGIIFYILMFAFYVYWALCIFSYAMVREVSYISEGDIRHGNVPMLPQQTMMENGPGAPLERAAPFNNPGHSVIILNNAKPKKRTDKFAFKRSIAPEEEYTIQFPYSPTPTLANEEQQLKHYRDFKNKVMKENIYY